MNLTALSNISQGGLAQAVDLRVLAMAMKGENENAAGLIQQLAQPVNPPHLGGSLDIRV